MAPLPKNSTNHFTHPHPLTTADYNQEFSCDGCKTLRIAKRFRCSACDFELHDYCATCPAPSPPSCTPTPSTSSYGSRHQPRPLASSTASVISVAKRLTGSSTGARSVSSTLLRSQQ
ncbi:hypothetical protein AAHA92_17330 [Salvia divinorum]|uniref:Phorbol-ester/DAG-type domain-containing protein n=1 Tax=Salvia divinorum TaxID=28513 RepID=A0ABD1H1B3_SALDI